MDPLGTTYVPVETSAYSRNRACTRAMDGRKYY